MNIDIALVHKFISKKVFGLQIKLTSRLVQTSITPVWYPLALALALALAAVVLFFMGGVKSCNVAEFVEAVAVEPC